MKAKKVSYSAIILDEECASLNNQSEEQKQIAQWNDEIEEN